MLEVTMDRIKSAHHTVETEVNRLDFSLQKRKMAEVFGWDSRVVDEMESQYRKFLSLSSALRSIGDDFDIVPNRLIDEFWHIHIMDTAKYHDDCKVVFGEYFHHYPYFGLIDENDTADWKRSSALANELWKFIYGEELYIDELEDAYEPDRRFHAEFSKDILASPKMSAARCRTGCKPVKCK